MDFWQTQLNFGTWCATTTALSLKNRNIEDRMRRFSRDFMTEELNMGAIDKDVRRLTESVNMGVDDNESDAG